MKLPTAIAILSLSGGLAYAQLDVTNKTDAVIGTGVDGTLGDPTLGGGLGAGTGIGSRIGTDNAVGTRGTLDTGVSTDDGVDTRATVKTKAKSGTSIGVGGNSSATGGAAVSGRGGADMDTSVSASESAGARVTVDKSFVGRTLFSHGGQVVGTIGWAGEAGQGVFVRLSDEIASDKELFLAESQLAASAEGSLVANMPDGELNALIQSRARSMTSAGLNSR